MTTEDFIIHLFSLVDDHMGAVPKHSQARLWPSELVTIGLLFALKGGYFRVFYRWLKRAYEALFVRLPHRTCLHGCWPHIRAGATSFWQPPLSSR